MVPYRTGIGSDDTAGILGVLTQKLDMDWISRDFNRTSWSSAHIWNWEFSKFRVLSKTTPKSAQDICLKYHTNSPKIRDILQQTPYRSIHGSLDKLYSSEINSLIDLSPTPSSFQGWFTPRLLSICLLKSPTLGENWTTHTRFVHPWWSLAAFTVNLLFQHTNSESGSILGSFWSD